MKRFRSASLAAVSLLLWITIAAAARPRYGGTLRVETSAAVRTLNPAASPVDKADAAGRRAIFPLVFETLVTPDPDGGLRGVLALAWEGDGQRKSWRFRLRPGVRLHDGTPLDSGRIAAALSAREPRWRITAEASSIAIEPDSPTPDLLWQLAESRNAIAFGRPEGGEPIGSGPFAIDRWEPKRLRLRAHDDHWNGRPFLDAVNVEMGRPLADQIAGLETGRTDFASVRIQDIRRASDRGLRLVTSEPRELVALVLAENDPPAEPLRRALTLALDRRAIWSGVLQRQGQPASALLPQWLSGYAAVLDTPVDRARARSLLATVPAAQRTLTLRLTEADPLLRSIAERVAVDAREVGVAIEVLAPDAALTRTVDMHMTRAGIDATTPERALTGLIHALGLRFSTPIGVESNDAHSARLERVYQAEQALRDRYVVPLVHLADVYATGSRVDNWNEPIVLPSGAWNLANTWLKAGAP